jgi:hypothetical protein
MQWSRMKQAIQLPTMIDVFFWIGLLVGQAVQASDLKGADDPALQAAMETWLADNDADSLPAFATLAADGNIAARLLLSRIEVTDQGPSDFVNGLSRKERVELFRSGSGSGLFRPTWLKSEKAAGNQFAAMLLESTNIVVDIDTIRNLYDFGEPEAAYDLIRETAGNGSPQQKQELADFLPEKSELMPYLQALQNPAAGFTPGHMALKMSIDGNEFAGPESDTSAAAYFVEYGYQTGVQATDFDKTNYYYNQLASSIESADVTAPIAALCNRYCGGETRDCAVTVFGVVGGYYKAIKFDSPMQTLVEQSRYVASERATGTVLRRVAFARAAGAGKKPLISDDELQAQSACLAAAVAEVRAQRN